MCLSTRDPAIKIAEEDILVYKTLSVETVDGETIYSSEGFEYEYKLGELNPTVKLEPKDIRMEGDNRIYEVEEGYHSDAVTRVGGFCESPSNALMVIPKGTKYIEGWFNDDSDRRNYVSETIIFKEPIHEKKIKEN